jgi:hypothetical protein
VHLVSTQLELSGSYAICSPFSITTGFARELDVESHVKQLANRTNRSDAKVVAFVAKMAVRCHHSALHVAKVTVNQD